ncbi:MAG: TrbG/VirB9 family P-type conjugative transfer protein, partial [Stellaceae bacterium]
MDAEIVMRCLLATALLAGVSTAALAADPPVHVPALDPAAIKTASVPAGPAYSLPPPINPLSPNPRLDVRERHAASLARRWRLRHIMPRKGPDGVVRWPYGVTQPSVVCSPEHECDIALEPGEVVQGITVGDKADWAITPQVSGAGAGRITHVQVRPYDSGLVTNILVTTDRRTYSIKLVSDRWSYVPLTGFTYPDNQVAAWSAYRQQIGADPPGTPASAGNVYFPYVLSGDDPTWRPLRVWSNGVKTWLLFAPGFQRYQSGAPVLEAITAGCGLCVFRGPATAVLRGGFHNYLRLIRRNCSACCANAHVCRSGMENGIWTVGS